MGRDRHVHRSVAVPPGAFREWFSGEDQGAFETVAALTAEVFECLDTGSEAFGPIRNDVILGKCHTVRTRQDWRVGVIGFDDYGWGRFLDDLAAIMRNFSGYVHFRALRRAFLDGYRSVRSVPVEQEGHLPVLMDARPAGHCLWAAGLVQSNGSAELDTAGHIA